LKEIGWLKKVGHVIGGLAAVTVWFPYNFLKVNIPLVCKEVLFSYNNSSTFLITGQNSKSLCSISCSEHAVGCSTVTFQLTAVSPEITIYQHTLWWQKYVKHGSHAALMSLKYIFCSFHILVTEWGNESYRVILTSFKIFLRYWYLPSVCQIVPSLCVYNLRVVHNIPYKVKHKSNTPAFCACFVTLYKTRMRGILRSSHLITYACFFCHWLWCPVYF